MTPAEIQEAWSIYANEERECEVVGVTYRGTEHSDGRPDKAIHILTAIDSNGDEVVVLVGDKGKRGPSLLKVGDSTTAKSFKSSAHFSLKGAGYDKWQVKTQPWRSTSSYDLWAACFADHHSASLEAKRAFLRLIGVDVGSAFEGAVKSAGVKEKPKPVDAYAANPSWGVL